VRAEWVRRERGVNGVAIPELSIAPGAVIESYLQGTSPIELPLIWKKPS
jgi:hypothetical protein